MRTLLIVVLWAVVVPLFAGAVAISAEQIPAIPIPDLQSNRNHCVQANFRFLSDAPRHDDLKHLVDGDLQTGVDAVELMGDRLEIQFRGRPPWVNVIQVFYTGELDCDVTVIDVFRNLRDDAVTMRMDLDDERGLKRIQFLCHPTRMIAVVLSVRGDDCDQATACELVEVEAYHVNRAADDDGKKDAGVSYVQWYKETACAEGTTTNTPNADEDAQSFGSCLKDKGWDWVHDWGDGKAWEKDFSTLENNSVDAVDFWYFSGHGGPGAIFFSHKKDGCILDFFKCTGKWGNRDLEWMALSSCQTLVGFHHKGWHRCFDGLHLLCGFSDLTRDVDIGEDFAPRILDKGLSVTQAWIDAAKFNHWIKIGQATRGAVILAEEMKYLKEGIWGSGPPVEADPTHDRFYCVEWQRWDGKDDYDNRRMAELARSDIVVLGKCRGNGPVLIAPERLVNSIEPDSIYELHVMGGTVDSFFAKDLAQDLCINFGLFCSSEILYNDTLKEYSLHDGPYDLYVGQRSGGWELIQSESFALPTETPPSLLSPGEADTEAWNFLTAIGRLPGDAIYTDPTWLRFSTMDTLTDAEIPDDSWDLSISSAFYRVHDGLYIAGPGANIELTFGDYGELQHVYYGGWRTVYPGAFIEVISISDAFDNLLDSGSEATIGGLPRCDSVYMTGGELGYFEPSWDTTVSQLEIVWVIHAVCVFSDTGSRSESYVDYDLIVPALHVTPRAEILQPVNGSEFYNTDTIVFEGVANTPVKSTYQFDWYSDIDGFLGTGQILEVTSLSNIGKHGNPALHTVILSVVDADSVEDFATVYLHVLAAYECGDAYASGGVDIDDVVWLISYIFAGGPAPVPLESGDADCSGGVDIDDVVYLINYIFGGGNAPCDIDGDGQMDC